jgi:co-chaperonin GroES (HSP10)
MSQFKKQKTLKFQPLNDIDLTKIPEAVGWNFIVQPLVPEGVTSGGFHIIESDQEDYKQLHCLGRVEQMGDLCFQHPMFGGKKLFNVGDIVYFNTHNGLWINYDGQDLVLLKDDSVSMKLKSEHLIGFDGFTQHLNTPSEE